MAGIKSFLDKYDTILFDMDGVITSEQAYWTTAAMTVYEMLYSEKYYGNEHIAPDEIFNNRKAIRKQVFCSDKTIFALKNKGVNSNWDLAYIVLAEALLNENQNDIGVFERIYERVCKYSDDIFSQYDAIAKRLSEKFGKTKEQFGRKGEFWSKVQTVFQRFYNGDGGSKAVISEELPLFEKEKIHFVLSTLKESGKSLGIGTGRILYEIKTPLTNWGVIELFDKDRVVTYDDVVAAENQMFNKGIQSSFTKPHPFMFLKAALKRDYPLDKLLSGSFDKEILKRTLVVGDAGADILSARAGGMDFMAVLTGVSGKSARGYFEKQGANYILDSVLDMIED